jgi:hypothetical protein
MVLVSLSAGLILGTRLTIHPFAALWLDLIRCSCVAMSQRARRGVVLHVADGGTLLAWTIRWLTTPLEFYDQTAGLRLTAKGAAQFVEKEWERADL